MPRFTALADALLISLSDSPDLGLTVPGKLASYMAAAKPVLASMNGAGYAAVLESGGGLVSPACDQKALADNIADGNPGKRKLTVLDFTDNAADLEGQQMPPPKAFLAAKQKNGKDLLAVQVYEETWRWLAERECARLVPAQILEQYAMAISRWIQCEECITEYGFLAKHPTTGNAIPSPYVAMSQSFSKQANNLWYQIYQVVRENCSVEYKGATPHDDMMERLLTARRGG